MAYKKLKIDGRDFGYVIGKKFVKIKTDRGSVVMRHHELLGVTEERLKQLYANRCSCWPYDCNLHGTAGQETILPGKVAKYIRDKGL